MAEDRPQYPEGGMPSDDAPPTEQLASGRTVVGIGASAGGLAALKAFFAEVPDDAGMAWVVVVHLSPDHESHLAELLQPHVRMPVQQVSDTVALEPDRVYVIPPNANLDAVDTHLRLSPLEERRQERAPIDHFLRTLARTQHGHAIGVILTGTGSDGTLGLRDVKEKGGLTVVQDPADAEYDGMPQSAISSGMVDLVLPLEEIPEAVLRLARTRPRVRVPAADKQVEVEERRLLQMVFANLRARTGRDFSRYKRSTLLRRIARRMQLLHMEELGDYLAVLRERPHEVHALADDLLITVTNFFRDPEVFEALEEEVIPRLVAGKGAGDRIRVWSVGCATGEEAYSLAILLLEAAAKKDEPPSIQIFASDLHERSLQRAREGFYPGDIETDVSAERLNRFFHREDGGYRVREEVRDLVVFAPHNLLADPPFSRIDLVACRNVLIYLQSEAQQDVIDLFHYALRPDGYLVLGTSETVSAAELFRVEDEKRCVYRKRNVPGPEPRLPVFPVPRMRLPGGGERSVEPGGEPIVYGALHQRMVELYAPPSLLVSPDDRVVHLSERAGRFLGHPGGELTASVHKLVREELRIELSALLQAVRERQAPQRSRPLEVHFDDDPARVTLHVRPVLDRAEDGFVLVIFDEEARPAGEASALPELAAGASGEQGDVARIVELQAELELARRRLQGVVEQYETGQEEMKASNEELQSSNEELRSTMEELETSKEELQSMNEELQTVNQENRHKVEELAQLSSDLSNLLSATDIATLFLDRELRILRFTPRLSELFNIRMTDRGRPIADLTHRLVEVEVLDSAARVLDTLVPIEREVRDDQGRWYLSRVLPYRSTDDRIEGVVLTFVDITQRKQAEEALRESEAQQRAIAELVPDLLWRSDPDGHTTWINQRWLDYTGQTAEETRGWGWIDAVDPEDREATREAYAGAVASGSPLQREHRLLSADGESRWFLVRAEPVRDEAGAIQHWFGAATDIHEQRQTLQSLEERVLERTRKLRELSATLTMAEQEERQRLSHLLHDDLQQLLYGIQMKLALALEQAQDGDTDLLIQHTGRSLELLEDAITRTRQLTVDLSPPVLQGEGLVEAVRWLETHMRDLHGLKLEVRTDGGIVVEPPEMRILLFQVVRELLFNVAKHAEAGSARVELVAHEGHVRITVSDDGLGFDPADMDDPARRSRGFGLFSARERLRLHGGDVVVESEPGEGTRVLVEAPLRPSAP